VAVRDRVVLWVLLVGGAVALLTWRSVGPWPAAVLGVAALLVASVAYRIEPPRSDLGGEPPTFETVAGPVAEAVAPSRQERIDQ
jgi:hypothetical protein